MRSGSVTGVQPRSDCCHRPVRPQQRASPSKPATPSNNGRLATTGDFRRLPATGDSRRWALPRTGDLRSASPADARTRAARQVAALVVAGLDPAMHSGAGACLAGGCRIKSGHDQQRCVPLRRCTRWSHSRWDRAASDRTSVSRVGRVAIALAPEVGAASCGRGAPWRSRLIGMLLPSEAPRVRGRGARGRSRG
jgi:hypothetical protein